MTEKPICPNALAIAFRPLSSGCRESLIFGLSLILFSGCASTSPDSKSDPKGNRALPDAKSCLSIFEKIKFRNQFYKSLRGRAVFSTPDGDLDLEVAVREPFLLRAEVVGPLGVRVALFVANTRWVQLFVPREKLVYRLPFEEYQKDSLRRDFFLKDLPFPAIPEFLVPSLLTQVSLDPNPLKKETSNCRVDEESHSLILEFPSETPKTPSLRYWLDADLGLPLKVEFFKGKMAFQNGRADLEVEYFNFKGEGASRFPLQSRFTSGGKKLPFEWNWSQVEVWENPSLEPFEWRPPASIFVKDF